MATITYLRRQDSKQLLNENWGKIQWLCGQEIDPDRETIGE